MLTYHHFDPPWHVRQHHEPEGMVAMCLPHHAAADRGIYSTGELRAFKTAGYREEEVKAVFPWSKRQFLVRLGGCYSGGTTVHLSFRGHDIFALNRMENGLLSVSLILPAADGSPAVSIRDNEFEAFPQTLHDLDVNTGPTRVKVWWKPRDVGLDLSFQRLTLEELDQVLDEDEAAYVKLQESERQPPSRLAELRPPERGPIPTPLIAMPTWLCDLVARNLEEQTAAREDLSPNRWNTRDWIKDWAVRNVLDDDSRVAFLDVKNLHIVLQDQELRVRDGITVSQCMLRYLASFDNAEGSFCL